MQRPDLLQYINEVTFDTYRGYIRVTYTEGLGITELAELIRALPGVTTVSPVEGNKHADQEIYKVKLITQKPGTEAFDSLKLTATSRYGFIKRVEVASQSIQKVG